MKKILIVEDDKPVAEILNEFLTDVGFSCEVAECGMDALDKLKERPQHFDLILSDFSMPKGDGEYLITNLRKEKIKTPLMFCTGIFDEAMRDKLVNLGAIKCLQKPYTMSGILKEIESALTQYPAPYSV